jgi:hypothetical protein
MRVAKKRTTPTPKTPARAARPLARQWRVIFQVRGGTEGDNHRARVAIETLGHLLGTDEGVRQLFSVLMKRHVSDLPPLNQVGSGVRISG